MPLLAQRDCKVFLLLGQMPTCSVPQIHGLIEHRVRARHVLELMIQSLARSKSLDAILCGYAAL